MNEPTNDYAEPQHDYLLVRELNHEDTSRGGIIMPNVEDPTGNRRGAGRYEVVAVGPGPWTDRVRPDGQFLRRPMSVVKGDVVTFQGKGFFINTEGAQLGVIQDYQIVAIYRKGTETLGEPVGEPLVSLA